MPILNEPLYLLLENQSNENALLEIVHAMTGRPVLISRRAGFFDVKSSIEYSSDEIICTTSIVHEGEIKTSVLAENKNGAKASDTAKRGYYLFASSLYNKTLPFGTLTGIRPAGIIKKCINEAGEKKAVSLMQKNYFVKREKAVLTAKTYLNQKSIVEGFLEKDICIYIGIPFCTTRCLYCSFISHPSKSANKIIEPYIGCLEAEILKAAEIVSEKGFNVRAIYIGGGTPSMLEPFLLDRLLLSVKNAFNGSYEFTLEAGRPDSFSLEKAKIIKNYNITRISINPQTLNDKVLEIIGRNHTEKDFYTAYDIAVKTGFTNINTDLIAALPGDSVEGFKNTAAKILALNPASVTLHTMCIKRGARLKGQFLNYKITGEEAAQKMVSHAHKEFEKNGYIPYYIYRQKDTVGGLENAGFSKKGNECIYNIAMMEDVSTVIALGAGAVTKILNRETGEIKRISNTKDAHDYIREHENILNKKSRAFLENEE